MPRKSTGGGSKREQHAAAKASKTWQTHVHTSSKAVVDKFLEEHPEQATQLEKFCQSALWKIPEGNQSKVERFCRGRTTINKLPPSYVASLMEQVSM
eukprot:3358691-Lingulodinium_polyedra.AAC.1